LEKKLYPDLPDPLKTTKNQPTLVVTHQICMPSLNAADIGRRRNPISGTHVPCDLKSGDGGGYLKGGDGGGDMIVYLA
jgi:hypothetical protein